MQLYISTIISFKDVFDNEIKKFDGSATPSDVSCVAVYVNLEVSDEGQAMTETLDIYFSSK